MKNKVVSLIMVIPLVLMFCVFSASNIASLSVPIAVSSVSVFHEEQEIVNLAEGNEFQINAQVYPRNASNKGLIYSYETVNKSFNVQESFLDINENGLVKALGCGTAKITVTTADGAYKKSFILEVVSTKAIDVVANLSVTGDIFVGDKFSYLTTIIPETTLDKNVVYLSSNPSVVKVNRITGECTAISSGRATITAKLDNGLNGTIEKSVEATVFPKSTSSLITFDGQETLNKFIYTDRFETLMEVNFALEYGLGKSLTADDIILTYDQTKVSDVIITNIENNNGVYKYNVVVLGIDCKDFNLKASINYGEAKNYYSEIKLTKVVDLADLEVSLENFDEYLKQNSIKEFNVEVLPEDFQDYDLEVSSTGSVRVQQKENNIYRLIGAFVGEGTVTIKINSNSETIKTITKNVLVLNPPTSINFSEGTKTYGIEDLLTIGDQIIINNNYEQYRHLFNFTANVNLDNIAFSSSDESIATFNGNELEILKEGKVTITATEQTSKLIGLNVSCSIDIRCVQGVNVSTYEELVLATDDGKQVVLTRDIMLGEKLIHVNDDGTTKLLYSQAECERILKSEIKQMKTTADWSYYKNKKGYSEAPEINYIIKFKNNCYGNGFVLNANNITNCLKGDTDKVAYYEFAQFRGPLDLVAITDASVKAQDNICFVASDNVILNNVELIGSDMRGASVSDLNQLNYAGTVLEVMGDNVNIVNSRVRNGRNCIRVYGKEYGDLGKINVRIESCIISHAREFLVKLGTNLKEDGNFSAAGSINLQNGNLADKYWEECSPKLGDLTHLNKGGLSSTQYNNLVQDYLTNPTYQNLVNTELTIENCVLHTSGLFSIGLESCFAGPALAGGRWGSWNFASEGWGDIAGTSLPAQLNLKGSVKLYDWKKLSHIDSSILIDGKMFNLDLAGMINNLYDEGKFNDIIAEINGEKYAHGGIVMYGGGKNYSLINMVNDEEKTEAYKMNNYSITLDSLNSNLTTMLKYASGREPFRIFMYGKNSSFNYYQQQQDMQNGTAYNGVGKYTL